MKDVCTTMVIVKNQYAGMCTVGCPVRIPNDAFPILDAIKAMDRLERDQMGELGVQVFFLC